MPKEVKQKSGLARGLNAGHGWNGKVGDMDMHTSPPSHRRPTHTPLRHLMEQSLHKSNALTCLSSLQKVTPRQPAPRVSRTKGHLSKRTAFVRDIVKEVAGLAPYERRVVELLRNSKDKRARKLAKRRLGTFGRAKRKVDEMTNYIAESRRAGH
ncbi:MAG: FAS1 domain-containing protein [Aureobasidium pullulans]|nr:MAG: FAS1 domain-containing protein [Aureobasidium pullulans]